MAVALLLALLLAPAASALAAGPSLRTEAPAAETARPRVRCWQEGRLLFEEAGWQSLAATARPDRQLHVSAPAGSTPTSALVIFEAGTATCLLER
jgi:hypothetical protein